MEFINEKELKSYFGIYAIVNKENNKYYIGQTRQRFQKRYWHHQWKLRNGNHDNVHLQNAWNVYGEESFYFTVLKSVECVEKLNKLEGYYINKYRLEDSCYNIQNGGQKVGYFKRDDNYRKSVGEKNRIHMLGKKHSDETKKKMSESRKGHDYNRDNYILNEDQVFKIKNMLISGIKPSKVAKELNINYKHVNNILSGNAWQRCEVKGWEEFLSSRKRSTRFSYEDCLEVYKLYSSGKYTHNDLAKMFNKTRQSIFNILNRVKDDDK